MYWKILFDRYLSNQKSRSRQPARRRAHSKKQLKAVMLFCRYLVTFPTKIAASVFREDACIFALIAHAKVKLSENLIQSFSDTVPLIAESHFVHIQRWMFNEVGKARKISSESKTTFQHLKMSLSSFKKRRSECVFYKQWYLRMSECNSALGLLNCTAWVPSPKKLSWSLLFKNL